MESYTFNILNLFVSFVAICVSLYTNYKQRKSAELISKLQTETNKGINRNQLESVYFQKIFFEPLITELPKARKNIFIEAKTGHLKDIDNLSKTINELKKTSVYFLYTNDKFYEKLKGAIEELDDFLISNVDKTVYECKYQSECLQSIDEKMKKIYNVIYEEYTKII